MAIVGVGAIAAFACTMIFVVPQHTSDLRRDWLVFGLLTAVGIGYVGWTAVSNRSIIIGLLGPAEILLASPVMVFSFRYPLHPSPVQGLFLALPLIVLFLYPWIRFEQVIHAVRRRTGLR
jgi:hypothetical protein